MRNINKKSVVSGLISLDVDALAATAGGMSEQEKQEAWVGNQHFRSTADLNDPTKYKSRDDFAKAGEDWGMSRENADRFGDEQAAKLIKDGTWSTEQYANWVKA